MNHHQVRLKLPRAPRALGALWVAFVLLSWGSAGCAARTPLPTPSWPLVQSEDAPFRVQPPALPPVALTDLVAPPEVHSAILPNGLTVWVVTDSRLPYVALSAVVRGAGTFDVRGAPELAHLTTRAVVEGGMIWTDGRAIEPPLVNGEGVRFEVWPSHSQLDLRVLRPALEAGVAILARTIRRPSFGDGSLDEVKLSELNVMLSERAGLSSIMLQTAVKAGYGGDFGQRAVPLRKEQVLDASPDAVRQSYLDTYQPDRSAIIAVGDVTLDEFLPLAREAWGTWERKSRAAGQPVLAPASQSSGRFIHFFPQCSPQGSVLILQPAPPALAASDELPYALLAEVAIGSFRSRANMSLRHNSGLTYGVHPYFLRGRSISVMTVEAAFEGDDLVQAIKDLLASFETLQTTPISSGELQHGKVALITQYERRWRDNTTLTQLLGQLFADGKSASWLSTLPSAVLAITPADVQRVAQRYLQPKDVEVGVSGDASLADQLRSLGRFQKYSVFAR